jgi:carboxypeptidase family protein/TonB-dependent receptor-like protein
MLRRLALRACGSTQSGENSDLRDIKSFLLGAEANSALLRRLPSLLATLIVTAAVTLLCTHAEAQVRFGSILGVVSDSSGASLGDATVKVTNLGTNETRSAKTNSAGTYSFPNLNAGIYRVEVEVAGFKRFTQDRVEVQVDLATRVDASMQVGNVTESVLVTSEAPPLQTDSASLGTTIGQKEVESIPLSGRNVNNMLTLVPGVVAQGGTYGNAASNQANGARTNAIGFGNYAIGGGFGNQSSFFVDGVSSNAVAGNLNSLIPSQDIVQEFRVATNNVSAEYGSYAGGVINLTTKSGTNAFHGTAYEYLRNKVLNANDYFTNRQGLPRPALVQNQFGATLGGPLVKNRTFFFGGFERQVIRSATQVQFFTVPTAAELAGDFSAPGLPTIYDPTTGQQFQCNGVLNVICPNRLDQSAVNIMTLNYPRPNVSGALTRNFVTQTKIGGVNAQYNIRLDHRLSDKNNLFGRYTYWKADSNPYDSWDTQTQGQGHTGLYTHEAVVGDTHAFNATTILDLRLAYLRVFQHEYPDSSGVDLSKIGPGWAALNSQLLAPANWPSMNFASDGQSISASNGIGSQLFWTQNVYMLSGTLTKILGRHQVKFGGSGRHAQMLQAPGNGVLRLDFNTTATANGGAGGSSLASALLGIPFDTQLAPGLLGGSRVYYNAYGFFVDDTFQATRKLTISAGLRWDQPGALAEANGNDTVFLPNKPSPLGTIFNPATGQNQQLMGTVALVGSPDYSSKREDNLHWKLFSPRLGVAYRVTDKTVLRAGYGISYPPTVLSQDGPNLSPVNNAPTFYPVSTPGLSVSNPYPTSVGGINQPLRRNATPTDFYGQGVFVMRVPGQPMSYVQQWNAAVERQIGKDASLTIAYAGSKGTHLLMQGWATVSNIGLNQLPDQYFSLGTGTGPGQLNEALPNPFAALLPNSPTYLSAPTITRGQLLRPFPEYNRVLELDPHLGTSNYKSLQTSFMKRFGSNGILSVAYTWSRLMSNTDSSSAFLDEGFIFGGSAQDNNHPGREYAVSSYDVPHNLSIGYGVDLPFGRGKHFMGGAHGPLNAVVGGWRVNGITTFRSGVPISVYQIFIGSTLSNLGGGQGYFGAQGLWMRPDFDPTCSLKTSGSRQQRAANGWFNKSCFSPVNTASEVRFGNEPRNVDGVRMDHMNNWDLSVAKRNDITERVYLQFTAEFFNAFNHVRFGAPDNNISDPPNLFGTITSQANPPRGIQFGLRVGF